MSIKTILSVFIAFTIGYATSPSYASDTISCSSFEGCVEGSSDVTNILLQMQAEIAALQGLVGSPDCQVRTSEFENLTGHFKNVTASCLAGEKVIAGGFERNAWSLPTTCDVVGSYPKIDQTAWIVQWALFPENDCAANTSKTYAICCK